MYALSPNGTQGDASSSPGMNRSGRVISGIGPSGRPSPTVTRILTTSDGRLMASSIASRATVEVHADQFEAHARVHPAGPARIAAPARQQRPYRDPVPGVDTRRALPADVLDDGTQLVTLNARIEVASAGKSAYAARIQMNVRPADPDHLRPHDDLSPASRTRLGNVIDHHLTGRSRHRREHLRPPR